MPSSDELSYEQEICNILKEIAIHQKIEEVREKTKETGKEHAFAVCSDGRITKVIEGDEKSVQIGGIVSECNNKLDLNIHSHPRPDKGYSFDFPSEGDLFVDLYVRPRIASCVYDEGNDLMECYRTSDRLRDKYDPMIKKAEIEMEDKLIAYKYSITQKDKDSFLNEYKLKKDEYNKLLNESVKEIVRDIWPGRVMGTISFPYSNERDIYYWFVNDHYRLGNFGDIWIEKCRFDKI
jgi:hypothetical protein